MVNIQDARQNSQESLVQTDTRGSSAGNSLVPTEQGPMHWRCIRGVRVTPISAQVEVREAAVLDSGCGRGSPFSNSNSHFRVTGHLVH